MPDSNIKSHENKAEEGNRINKVMIENSMSRELDQLIGLFVQLNADRVEWIIEMDRKLNEQKMWTGRQLDDLIGHMNVQNEIGADLISKLDKRMEVVYNSMSVDEVIHFYVI